jgi:poly-gamma-glutamate synthesis protein (capsule biosynthesis protein)
MQRVLVLAISACVAWVACSGRPDDGHLASAAPRPAPPAPDAAARPVAPPPIDAGVTPPPAPRAARIELTFTGDINFGGYFDDHYDPQEVENYDPLVEVDALLQSDLIVSNLETTITRKLPNGGKSHDGKGNKRFVTIPERVAILPRHHITTVTLANNHQFDNSAQGLVETPAILTELGITSMGAARAQAPRFRIETVDVKGWHLGFIVATTELNLRPRKDATPLIAFSEPKALTAELVPLIAEARKHHDLVVLELHWGVQYQDTPEPWQIAAAHAFIDAGADAVIGHHPHVLQAIERYHHGLIAYSLGNFVFPNAKEPIRQTGVLRLGFATQASAACLDLAAFHPAVQIRAPLTHPIPALAKLQTLVAERLFRLSAARPIATKWRIDNQRFVTEPACTP